MNNIMTRLIETYETSTGLIVDLIEEAKGLFVVYEKDGKASEFSSYEKAKGYVNSL